MSQFATGEHPESPTSFFKLALSGQVVATAVKVSILVGTLLAFINHGTAIVELSLSSKNMVQIGLTYLVPYCVSSYSSVRSLQHHMRSHT